MPLNCCRPVNRKHRRTIELAKEQTVIYVAYENLIPVVFA
jgi:hypothetical protein